MMKYAVTAATGRFGRVAVEQLVDLVGKDQVVAIVRDVAKGRELLPAGIEIRQGDYADQAGMTSALAGIDRLLFISSQPGGASFPGDATLKRGCRCEGSRRFLCCLH